MTNIDTVIADIKETVAPLMEKWVADRVTSIMNLKEYIKTLDSDPEYKESYDRIRSNHRWYSRSDHEFGWLEHKGYLLGDIKLAKYRSENFIKEQMQKEASAKLEKIDVAVAKKINFDVHSVEKLCLAEGKDGYFEGAWKINGEKTFSFNTIFAGGYHIQRAHVRTKYKLK